MIIVVKWLQERVCAAFDLHTIMSQFALNLAVALLLLCHAGTSGATNTIDPATHHPAPPSAYKPLGHETKLAGLNAYVSGSPSASKAVLMMCDVFGYTGPLFRKLADKFAAAGYYVVAPDFFFGDYYVLNGTESLDTYLAKHTVDGSVGTANKVIDMLRSKGYSVGIAGFCWGAKLGATVSKQGTHVKVLVQAHPYAATASDYAEVTVPIMVLAAPEDGVQNFLELLRKRKREHLKVFVKIFKGVMHGWTIRYDDTDPKAVYKANRAYELLLKWLLKYLPVEPKEH